MSVTLAYDSVNVKVTINATALAAANVATIERSIDQIMWQTVRGGAAAPVVAGVLTPAVDDYEFVAGMTNFYRVRGVETAAAAFVAAGTATSGNNSSLVPPLPAGIVAGDLLLILASIRNSGAGNPNPPAGYAQVADNSCMRIFGKYYDGVESAPTVTFSGGVANADTLAQMAAFRSAGVTPVAVANTTNGSAQNVNLPAHTAAMLVSATQVLIYAAWKQDDATTYALAGPSTSAGLLLSSTAGDDASQKWDYLLGHDPTGVDTKFVVTGGAAAISKSSIVALPHAPFLNEQISGSITPALDRVWIKSPTHPFLNRPATIVDWSPIQRAGRGEVFNIVGRSFPIAVTELRGSRQWALSVYAYSLADAQTLDYALAAGEVLFVHTPLGCPVPSGYVAVDGTSQARTRPRGAAQLFGLECQEVVAPGPDVVYASAAWAPVLATYATWAALLLANPTWAQLVARLAPASGVIVP